MGWKAKLSRGWDRDQPEDIRELVRKHGGHGAAVLAGKGVHLFEGEEVSGDFMCLIPTASADPAHVAGNALDAIGGFLAALALVDATKATLAYVSFAPARHETAPLPEAFDREPSSVLEGLRLFLREVSLSAGGSPPSCQWVRLAVYRSAHGTAEWAELDKLSYVAREPATRA